MKNVDKLRFLTTCQPAINEIMTISLFSLGMNVSQVRTILSRQCEGLEWRWHTRFNKKTEVVTLKRVLRE